MIYIEDLKEIVREGIRDANKAISDAEAYKQRAIGGKLALKHVLDRINFREMQLREDDDRAYAEPVEDDQNDDDQPDDIQP